MARYTSAYSNLVKRLDEVSALRSLAGKYSGFVGSDGNKNRALCRSGVVLLCSHVEGYFGDLTAVILERVVSRSLDKSHLAPAFFYFLSRDVIVQIKDTADPAKITPKIKYLLDRDRDIWSDEKTFKGPLSDDRFLSNFATPDFRKVQSLVRRFGYDSYADDLRAELKAQYTICVNMINQVVIQRNKIAHGDHMTAATPSDL